MYTYIRRPAGRLQGASDESSGNSNKYMLLNIHNNKNNNNNNNNNNNSDTNDNDNKKQMKKKTKTSTDSVLQLRRPAGRLQGASDFHSQSYSSCCV